MHFYKHFLGDYARDTAHLSLVEHGAYRVLLDTYYATAKPLPAGKDALYRITKAFTAGERKAVDLVAEQFFPVNGDGFRHNHRADAEIEKERQFSESQRDRANRRWGNAGSMPPHMPKRMPEKIPDLCGDACRNDATTATVKQSQTHSRPSDAFVRFWQAYPRRKNKGDAEKAFKKISPDQALETEILSAIDRAKAAPEWRKEGGRYIPYPASWLNAKGWLDEIGAPRPEQLV